MVLAETVYLVQNDTTIWQAVIAGIVTLALGWMQRRTQLAVQEIPKTIETTARAAAVDVKSVKDALAAGDSRKSKKLDEIAKVGEATHVLVNSNMEAQLQVNSVLAHRVAELTNDPVDMEVARKVDKLLAEYLSKHAAVDSGDK